MLSTRGRNYAALDLAASYTKDRDLPYDKTKHPAGLVSFRNAENVSMSLMSLLYTMSLETNILNSFSCAGKSLTT